MLGVAALTKRGNLFHFEGNWGFVDGAACWGERTVGYCGSSVGPNEHYSVSVSHIDFHEIIM
jgi:hypothetical protein